MTSHPKDLSDALINVIAEEKKVCNHLHLPFQAGSDRILKLMNRKYTSGQYLNLVRKVRSKIPDIVLTADVIVGFPGETEEDFEKTLELVRAAEFDMLYTFLYSKRNGTPAARMEDYTTDKEKHEWFNRLLALQNEISKKKNQQMEGNEYTVLVEGVSKTDETVLTGRTEGNKIVNFVACREWIGRYAQVKITKAYTWSLSGELINHPIGGNA